MSEIKGTEASVSSIPSPTVTIDNVTGNSTGFTGTANIPPSDPIDFSKIPEGTYYGFIHASNAQYYVARLLGNVLSQIDASVPNKDQNKAMKHLVRKEFDRAIMDVNQMAWPSIGGLDCQKAQQVVTGLIDGYILQPEK